MTVMLLPKRKWSFWIGRIFVLSVILGMIVALVGS
jgi:hypothetical protein